jgi:hypothetical protein
MKRFWFLSLASLLVTLSCIFAVFAAEDYQPIRPGMKLTFIYITAHMEQKDKIWKVTVEESSFPQSLTYTWQRTQKGDAELTGTRILSDLNFSRNFNPIFLKNESKATSDTAPWISLEVLKELRDKAEAGNFREGGSGAVNWAATALKVKEKMIYPVLINGKPEALNALKLSKGLVVWNNLKNPLVLQYEPLGIPLFTSLTGWKLTEINY